MGPGPYLGAIVVEQRRADRRRRPTRREARTDTDILVECFVEKRLMLCRDTDRKGG
jgi:hypothetical protein